MILQPERVILARHTTTTGEIQLQQRTLTNGSLAFEIISNGVFLMASYNQVSERALVQVALQTLQIDTSEAWPCLIGGLGMGFTLQEALYTGATTIDVVEIDAHIIDWNQSYFAQLNGQALTDKRVQLIQDDLYSVLLTSPVSTYYAILLDVDNGPSWLSYQGNARLYTVDALQRWATLLKPGGSFAVWSAQREPAFLATLKTVFNQTDEIPVVSPHNKNKLVTDFIYRAVV